MIVPREYIERFTDAINTVSERTSDELRAALEAIDYTQDVATIRQQAVGIMQAYCGGASDLTAQLAAEFYDGLRELEIGEPMGAYALSGRVPEATDGAVRAFAQKLVDGNADSFVELCLERLDYEAKVAAAKCVIENGKRDRRKPRFARVPTGVETCDFCLMLASRGFVYQNEEAASHTHANCDCRIVPSWKSFSVAGYDPRALYDRWQESIDAKAKERAERNGTSESEERKKIIDAYERSSENAKKRNRR